MKNTLVAISIILSGSFAVADWKLDLLVNGDANCNTLQSQEPLQLVIQDKNKFVDGLKAFSVKSVETLMSGPFELTDGERSFLKKAKDLNFLKAHLTEYNQLSENLFYRTFGNRFVIESRTRIVKLTDSIIQWFFVRIDVADLLEYQTWYFDEVIPKVSAASGVSVVKTSKGETIIPLLIYGTVKRSGRTPSYKIEFDPSDTIITANPQNEVFDTTLCQLRIGMFDPTHTKKADISINKFLKIEKL